MGNRESVAPALAWQRISESEIPIPDSRFPKAYGGVVNLRLMRSNSAVV
jgi:hypothetical protein